MSGFPNFTKGHELTANDLNQIVGGEGLYATSGGAIAVIPGSRLLIAKSVGTITARSGATAGTGTVSIQSFDGADLADSGWEQDVFNFAGGGDIPDGVFVSIGFADDGYCWVISSECYAAEGG